MYIDIEEVLWRKIEKQPTRWNKLNPVGLPDDDSFQFTAIEWPHFIPLWQLCLANTGIVNVLVSTLYSKPDEVTGYRCNSRIRFVLGAVCGLKVRHHRIVPLQLTQYFINLGPLVLKATSFHSLWTNWSWVTLYMKYQSKHPGYNGTVLNILHSIIVQSIGYHGYEW